MSPSSSEAPSQTTEYERIKAQQREVNRQEEQLRIERRQVREQRKVEDKAYETVKAQHKSEHSVLLARNGRPTRLRNVMMMSVGGLTSSSGERESSGVRKRIQPGETIRAQKEKLKAVAVWVAILVIVDNS